MNKDQAFEQLVADFPFAEISKRMGRKPKWYWGGRESRHIPTPQELESVARRLFGRVKDRETVDLYCGGVGILMIPGRITLYFGHAKDRWATHQQLYIVG